MLRNHRSFSSPTRQIPPIPPFLFPISSPRTISNTCSTFTSGPRTSSPACPHTRNLFFQTPENCGWLVNLLVSYRNPWHYTTCNLQPNEDIFHGDFDPSHQIPWHHASPMKSSKTIKINYFLRTRYFGKSLFLGGHHFSEESSI